MKTDIKSPLIAVLSVYSATNLVEQAAQDGFEEQNAKDPALILERNRKRRQRQCLHWGVYLNEYDSSDDLAIEEANITTNCYVHLLSSYVNGYLNGYRVVAKAGKSPFALQRGLAHADLSANVLKRAYVYGWYSACYDYFRRDIYLDNIEASRYYAFWLSFFIELENGFLYENAK